MGALALAGVCLVLASTAAPKPTPSSCFIDPVWNASELYHDKNHAYLVTCVARLTPCRTAAPGLTWGNFYELIGLEAPSDEQLCDLLRQAVVSSEAAGYHAVRRRTGAQLEALLRYRRGVDKARFGGREAKELGDEGLALVEAAVYGGRARTTELYDGANVQISITYHSSCVCCACPFIRRMPTPKVHVLR